MAENLPVDPGVPSDFSVPAMILPPGAQARVGAPVVASGNNAPRPTTLQGSSFTPYAPVEYQRQEAPPEMAPEMTQRQRLADFFFGMANSQSPSFFGAIGQAGQALSAGDRQRATEARANRAAQAEENYRAAQIAVENAKLALEQNPDSPANVARLATAEAQRTSARAALINAQRGPQAPQDQTVLVETTAGPGILNMRTNTITSLPAGTITPQMQQRRDAQINGIQTLAARQGENAVQAAQTVARNAMPPRTLTPDEEATTYRTAYDRVITQNRPMLERLGAPLPAAAPAAPAGGGNVRTFDATGTREIR